jgi:lambda family phage portal protein
VQRLICRSWLRDGEALTQLLIGRVKFLDHGTQVPFSIELIESDLLPIEYTDMAIPVIQGVELNGWNRPRAYWLYKTHPGATGTTGIIYPTQQLLRKPAETMLHVKLIDRIGQVRGVSCLASILTRMDDIKDYEESERIAAKIAASMTAVVKKGTPDLYDPLAVGNPRQIRFQPGMIFDDLMPGESVETINSTRPNAGLESYRNGQLRAAAAGMGLSYSSLARDYNGTYSAQRQEMVEQAGQYDVLSSLFVHQFVRPIWQAFVSAAMAAGMLKMPRNADLLTLDHADYRYPAIPWIDPEKEMAADAGLIANYFASPQQIIRERGGDPIDVLNQLAQWDRLLAERQLPPSPAQTKLAAGGGAA